MRHRKAAAGSRYGQSETNLEQGEPLVAARAAGLHHGAKVLRLDALVRLHKLLLQTRQFHHNLRPPQTETSRRTVSFSHCAGEHTLSC